MEKINEECKLAGNIQPFMFFNIKELVTKSVVYIPYTDYTECNNWYLEIRPSWARVYKFPW